MPKQKEKSLKYTIEQFREWGSKGGKTSAKTNSKRLKELHRLKKLSTVTTVSGNVGGGKFWKYLWIKNLIHQNSHIIRAI